MKDLTGQKFGRLTPLKPTEKRINRKVVWLCKCDCGNETEVISTNLSCGSTRSCGCLNKELSGKRMKNLNKDKDFLEKRERRRIEAVRRDYTGERFGMLVAIRPTEKRKYNNQIVWEFRCDCGNYCYKSTNQLYHNNPNCGCMTKEKHKNNGCKSISNLHSEIGYGTNAKMIRGDKARKDSSSGIRGVIWAKWANAWRALITFKKKTYHLGYFKNKEDAIKARKNAEGMLFEPFMDWYEEQKKHKKI